MCTEPGAAFIAEKIHEKNLNRVIVAACTPITHEPVFQSVLKDGGLHPRYLEFCNIREHDAFVHMKEPEEATKVAKELLRAAVGRATDLESVPTKTVKVSSNALVIGAGIAGLTAALDIADAGYDVYLVEKETTIGGKMAMMDRVFPTDDCSI